MAAASAGPLSFQVTSVSSNPSVCQAPFALNRQRLEKNLVQAASCGDEPDVMTEVKNSDKFVSLKCSLAFFQSVACPVLLSLGPSFNNETDGFLVSAADKHRVDTVDTTGLVSTHLLKFTVMANTSPPSLLARVSVHLHKTRNSVDIHSESFLPNQLSAAVWFSKTFLAPRLHKKSKSSDFSKARVASMHAAVLSAFSTKAASKNAKPRRRSSKCVPGQGVCYQCGGQRLGMPTCPGCLRLLHVGCMKTHSCNLLSPPTAASTPSSPSPASRKRPAPLDFTVSRSQDSRNVRQHLDIDSDSSLDESPAANTSSPPPLCPETAQPPASTGQQQLIGALASLQLPAPSQAGAAALSVVSPAPLHSLPMPPPKKKNAQGKKPGLTPETLNAELLQRELVMAQTKLVSMENAAEQLRVSNGLLAKRIQLFEQRENDRNCAQYFPNLAASAPPPSASPPSPPLPVPTSSPALAPSSPPAAHESSASSPPEASQQPSCHASSSLLLTGLRQLQQQVHDIQAQVLIISRTISPPKALLSNPDSGLDLGAGSSKVDQGRPPAAHTIIDFENVSPCPNPLPGTKACEVAPIGSTAATRSSQVSETVSGPTVNAAESENKDNVPWYFLIPGVDLRCPPPGLLIQQQLHGQPGVPVFGPLQQDLNLTLPLEPVQACAAPGPPLPLQVEAQHQLLLTPAAVNDLPASDILIMEEQLSRDIFPFPKVRKNRQKGRKRAGPRSPAEAPPLIDLN